MEVLEVNGLVTVQGAPMWGRRHHGIPEGGGWDTRSALAANARFGNGPSAPVLELSMARLVLKAIQRISMATAGAPAPIHTSRRDFRTGERILLEEGEMIEFEVPTSLVRTYIAFPGGVQQLLSGTQIRPGMTLLAGKSAAADLDLGYALEMPSHLSVIPSANETLPTELVASGFRVGFRSNRVGIRLEGPALEPRKDGLSEPACHGMIQLDNSGSLIILGPDGPTIGGYPRIGVVASSHLHYLAQLRPGSEIRFRAQT